MNSRSSRVTRDVSQQRRTRLLLVLVLAACVLAAGVGASAARTQRQSIAPLPPGISTPPGFPTIPGQKTREFKLVLDGTSEADRVADIGGKVGECNGQLHADIQESVDFGRGKGVIIKVVETPAGNGKKIYSIARGNAPARFTVVAHVARTASGQGELTPVAVGAACQARTDQLNQSPDCKKPVTDRVDWGFQIENDHFRPRPQETSVLSPSKCGLPPDGSPWGSDVAELSYQWPTPAVVGFEPLPLQRIFKSKSKRPFKVDFKSLSKKDSVRTDKLGTPPLTGTYTDHGETHATVRFIPL